MPELTPNYKFKKPIPDKEVADITVINENFDIADNELKKSNDSIKNLENNKQNKEDSTLKTVVKTIVGAINELYDELVKKASKTQLGRIKVGRNLTVDEDGTLHGNPGYTHPTGNGNNHIPADGTTGNFLKWVSSGAAQWINITWNDITGKPNSFTPNSHNHTKANITDFPTSMKNPYALSIQLNSGTANTYDGAAAKSINITPASIGAAASSHTHTKANITDFPTSMKNPNTLEIKMNGQNSVSYDGAAAKSINITASGIGAEPAFNKNTGFNKNIGTTNGTVLEGSKLAEILGLTYGGSLNNSNTKTLNYAYYDNTTKKVYKCIKSTTLNYADSSCFEAISNNDLLGKLQNLNKSYLVESGNNSNGYYRKYSDGFIEQWGITTIAGTHGSKYDINFPISFKNTNYTFTHSIQDMTYSTLSGVIYLILKNVYTNKINIQYGITSDGTSQAKVFWYACGY